MNTKNKATLSVMLMISLMAAVFLFQFYKESKHFYDFNIQLLTEQLNQGFSNQKDIFQEKYPTRLRGFIKTNTSITNAFKQRDRQGLYNLTLAKFNTLKKEYNYLFGFTYILPDATIFLRMHQPDFFDDSVAHIPFASYVLEQKNTCIGFAITKIGAFFRVVAPVYDGDEFVGAIGWAFKVSLLAENISKSQHVVFGILAEKERYKKFVPEDENMVEIGSHVLVESNSHLFKELPGDFNYHLQNQFLSIAKGHFLVHSDRLTNYAGEHIGDILFAVDITAAKHMFRKQIINTVLMTLLIMLFSFIILNISFGKLIGQIEDLNATLEQRVKERTSALQESLDKVNTLSGMLPICASCKKIRDDKGYWNQIESYIKEHSEAEFSHGICPECAASLYPYLFKEPPSGQIGDNSPDET